MKSINDLIEPNTIGKAVTLAAMLGCSSFANAATVSLSSLTALSTNTFTSGGLTFDNFTASPAGGSTTIDFSNITVTDLIDDGTNGAGIQFDIINDMFALPAGQTANMVITYTVSATSALSSARLAFGGCNSNPITDADCTGVTKSGSGLAVFDQNVQYNGAAVNNIIDNGSFTYFEKNAIPLVPPHVDSDITTFMSISGGTGGVTLTSFEDRYDVVSAVPLPAGIWLFGSGLMALIGFNRKQS